jgi:TPR repeat protein
MRAPSFGFPALALATLLAACGGGQATPVTGAATSPSSGATTAGGSAPSTSGAATSAPGAGSGTATTQPPKDTAADNAAHACVDYTWSDSPHPGQAHQDKEDACRVIGGYLGVADAKLQELCTKNDPGACNALGILRDQLLAWYVEGLSLPQCGGDHDCWSFLIAERGAPIEGTHPDPAGAVSYYDRACGLGRADACMSVARLSADTDKAKAATYYRKACDLGRAGACAFSMNDEMKKMLQNTAFFTEAYTAFRKACDTDDDASGCNDAGVLLATGRGATKDQAGALALLDKGCGLHGSNACGNLVYFYLRWGASKGQAPDYARGQPVLKAACDEGNPRACHALGWMLMKGIGVAADPGSAAKLLKTACDQGACEK